MTIFVFRFYILQVMLFVEVISSPKHSFTFLNSQHLIQAQNLMPNPILAPHMDMISLVGLN